VRTAAKKGPNDSGPPLREGKEPQAEEKKGFIFVGGEGRACSWWWGVSTRPGARKLKTARAKSSQSRKEIGFREVFQIDSVGKNRPYAGGGGVCKGAPMFQRSGTKWSGKKRACRGNIAYCQPTLEKNSRTPNFQKLAGRA